MNRDILKALAKALAPYLSEDQARKSIDLQLGKPYAREWAQIRTAANVRGYATTDDTERHLLALFGVEEKS